MTSQLPERPQAIKPPIAAQALPPAIFEVDKAGYDRLAREANALLGIDLQQYKPVQMWRRVNSFASSKGFKDVDALLAGARTDPALKAALKDMLSINVSEFFRNPDAYDALLQRHLGPMLRAQSQIRIWSAGCSYGFEPYSLAMMAKETAPGVTVRILASDLDETVLNMARAGRYNQVQMQGVSPARRARFFTEKDGTWEVKPEIRSLVTFKRHDLLKEPFDSGFDLVACRNVVIYFTDEAKTTLYERFAKSLRPDGILFVGSAETILRSRDVGLEPAGLTFYRRVA
jgi:chemotaxis protein methyltransferase CheR